MASPLPRPSAALVSLLASITLSCLAASLESTAVFFAERLHALDPRSEPLTWLLACSLLRNGEVRTARRLLDSHFVRIRGPSSRGSSSRTPTHQVDASELFANGGFGLRWDLDWRTQEVGEVSSIKASHASLRLAYVYALACKAIGRYKEGGHVLQQVISEPSLEKCELMVPPIPPIPSMAALHILNGNLAVRSHDYDSASKSYRQALTTASQDTPQLLCWEAFESLCITGKALNTDLQFVDKFLSAPFLPGRAQAPPPSPPPPEELPAHKENSGNGLPGKGKWGSGGGMFSPNPFGSSSVQPTNPVLTSKDFMLGLGTTIGVSAGMNLGQVSLEDSSIGTFDYSYYASRDYGRAVWPGNPARPHNATGGTNQTGFHNQLASSVARSTFNRSTPFSGPPVSTHLAMPAAGPSSKPYATPSDNPTRPQPGIKRSRSRVGQVAEVQGRLGSEAPPTGVRRSTRVAAAAAVSTDLAATSKTGRIINNPREKKRAKGEGADARGGVAKGAKRGKAVERSSSEAGEPASPNRPANGHRHRSSADSSGSNPTLTAEQKAEREAAMHWVFDIVEKFGKATMALARYDCQGVLDAVWGLPPEQKRTWKAYCLIARAKFELLDYHSANLSFAKAREAAPYRLEHMDRYSTLLWHLKRPIHLSFLAQELKSIDPQAPEAWIAAGNVFSQVDDHANALRCFRRAAQSDQSRPYAFTLAGHECVGLEEWDRAAGFFREALRRDPRHYNAWFGLGQVYMKQGKLRMAEFHLREASRINPTNALLLCAVGGVLEARGKPKEALELYEKGVQLAPTSASVRFCRAKVLVSLKAYDAAKLDLTILKDAEPTEFNVHYLLGKVYAITHDKAAAVRQLAYAQDLDPRAAARIRRVLEGGNDLEEDVSQREESKEVETRQDETM